MNCPKCGAKNNSKAKFCLECAAPLIAPVETVIEETVNNDIQLEELKTALKDKYEIIREIGRGGMGIVYECKELSLDRTVALKVLPRELSYDKQFVERFKKEIKILAQIEHPNIVQLISADEVNGFIFFTMKYVKGRTLADLIKEKGEIDPKEAMRISIQIAQALSCAHEANVLHRDLKPENVMIDERGHVYIMDFGIARVLDGTRMTRTGSAIGTPEYMSPEQCSGESEPDCRSDIYSLGILMYEMLTGMVPFKGEPTSVMYQHVHVEPVPLAKLAKNASFDIINLVNTCIEKKPDKRLQSAVELIAQINCVFEVKHGIKRWGLNWKQKPDKKIEEKSRLKKIALRTFKISIGIVTIFIFHILLYKQYFLIDIVPSFYLKAFDADHFSGYYFGKCYRKMTGEDYHGIIADCTRAIDLGYKILGDGVEEVQAEIYSKLSEAKWNVDDFDGAISDLSNAIMLSPNDASLYSDRGRAKGYKGDFDSALIDFELALKIDPKNSSIYRRRGYNKYLQNNIDGAISDATIAIKIATDKIKSELVFKNENYSSYGYYYFYGPISKSLYDLIKKDLYNNKFNFLNDDSSIDLKKQMIKKGEYAVRGDFEVLSVNYNSRGEFKFYKKDFLGAIDDCSNAIDIDPKYSDAYFNRGKVKHELGDIVGAIYDYTRAIDLKPDNADVYKKRSEAKKMKGDDAGSKADLEKWESLSK